MHNYPLVTVGVPSYNNAPFVLDTLNSILHQTYPNLALRIIDDGSSDSSVEIINEWLAKHASRFPGGASLEVQTNTGITGVFNRILDSVNSPYITLLGSDDVMLPDRISILVKHMEAHPDVMLIHSNYQEIDANNQIILSPAFPSNWPPDDLDYPDALINGYKDRMIVLHSPTALYRTDAFRAVGKYNTNFVQEDLDMLLRITERFPIAYHPDVLFNYRVLPNSLSRSPERQVRIQSDKIKLLHHLESEGRLLPSVHRGLAFGYLRLFFLTFQQSDSLTRADLAAKIFQYGDKLISQADKQTIINRCYVNDFPLCKKLFQQYGWRSGHAVKDMFIRIGLRIV